MTLFEDLQIRGLIKQTTNQDKVANLINSGKCTFYIGFDPTADSLHVGHLLQLIFAKRMMKVGNTPILLIGTSTAKVGDPTGKTDMRKMLSLEEIQHNTSVFQNQITNILGWDNLFITNNQHLEDYNWISLLQEFGKYFSVNSMIKADCFKSRLEGKGLSFLEFNYMVMQALDFYSLYRSHQCQLQVGGDDQWSNMLAGINLIHKKDQQEAFALTLPLLMTSDNKKMGKTQDGAIWLDPNKTSPLDFFQYWRNINDQDVRRCFELLTFKSIEEIDIWMSFNINIAKEALASELTKIVHGEEVAANVLNQVKQVFAGNSDSLIPSLVDDNQSLVDLLLKAEFAKSKTEARNLIKGRGISINDKNIVDIDAIITSHQYGNQWILRKGKKNFFKFGVKSNGN